MKSSNLGVLVILSGVAIIGFIWFKKNKPTIANKQLEDIKKNQYYSQLNEKIDVPFSEQGIAKIEKEKIKQDNWNLWNVPLTPAQIAEMEKKGYKGSQISPIIYQLINMDLRNI
jgi:hypothetical protein